MCITNAYLILLVKLWSKYFRYKNIKSETESLLLVVQNNSIRTNNIKTRIDKTQKIANVGYVLIETKPWIT